ncbi:FeoB-associated Cys-rich membrane protein, partial [Candidatus Bathyarchaeota archaeon]|nr:FeoB-associated Cys-rich membrane protein [Candidatus Bathyarchaeota archaeon]
EHFNVTAYYNDTPIETEAGKSLQMSENMTITLSWDTSGVAEGDYQIWAEATDVEGEGNLQDNKFIDGTVTVKSAQELFPTNIIVGAIIAVAVLALVFVSLYGKKKRKPPNSDSTAFLG